MKVKLQGLLNAAKYIRSEYGDAALESVLSRCRPEVRERVETGIAIEWHPREELIELIEVAEAALVAPDLAVEAGAAGGRANMSGFIKRAAFWLANPSYITSRAAGLWPKFNDQGEMHILEVDSGLVRYEVTGVSEPNWTFCQLLTGWGRELALSLGFKRAAARHVSCRAKGADRCIWEVTYIAPEDGP